MEEFDARRAAMDLVTAFVNNHPLTATDLPKLLTDVFTAVSAFGTNGGVPAQGAGAMPEPAAAAGTVQAVSSPAPSAEPVPAPAVPAVSIEESTRDPDYIISLINGEKFKTLKRHLRAHGLTEAEYRERYDLPGDYPFVAPSYSKLRRGVATKMGFGQRRSTASGEAAGSEHAPAAATTEAAKVAASQPSRARAKPNTAGKAKAAESKAVSTPPAGEKGRAAPPKRAKAAARPEASKASGKTKGKAQANAPEASAAAALREGKAERPKRTRLSPIFG